MASWDELHEQMAVRPNDHWSLEVRDLGLNKVHARLLREISPNVVHEECEIAGVWPWVVDSLIAFLTVRFPK